MIQARAGESNCSKVSKMLNLCFHHENPVKAMLAEACREVKCMCGSSWTKAFVMYTVNSYCCIVSTVSINVPCFKVRCDANAFLGRLFFSFVSPHPHLNVFQCCAPILIYVPIQNQKLFPLS